MSTAASLLWGRALSRAPCTPGCASGQNAMAVWVFTTADELHIENVELVNDTCHGYLDLAGALAPCFPQALQCCDEGAYLLANQQMDKCQSKEGAQKALQDIERFLESSSPYLNYDPQSLQYDFESVLTAELKVSQYPNYPSEKQSLTALQHHQHYCFLLWFQVQNSSSYLMTEVFFTLQCQIQSVQVKLENVRSMFENRQSCFKKLLDKHVRPVQLVAPRPENPPRSKSPLFSPKHGQVSSWLFSDNHF